MYTKDLLYEAINKPVLECIPQEARRILDLGCGSGALGKQVKQKIDCKFVGVTNSELEASTASQYLDQVLIINLNRLNVLELGKYDCIICSHILEHLYKPDELLTKLSENLEPEGLLVIALPNALHWKQRIEFLAGRFRYTDGGLMDKTHYRFFDWDTSLELLEGSGFKVIYRKADGYFPLPFIRKFIPSFTSYLDKLAVQTMPGLFGVQFVIIAQLAHSV